MKKRLKIFILFIFMFIVDISSIYAAETLYTCTYKTSKLTNNDKKITLKYSIMSDKTTKLPFKNSSQYVDSVLDMAVPWSHNSGFSKDFYKKAEESGKCPTITVTLETGSVVIYLGTKTKEEWLALQKMEWESLNGTKAITKEGKNEGVKDVVETTSCEKEINYKVNNKSSIVKLKFWMMSNGQKYWKVDGIEGKANETIYSTLFNGYNASYSITENEIDKIYKQTDDQKKKNEFTCPTELYLNENNTLDYLITTNKNDSNSTYGQISDPIDIKDATGETTSGCAIFGDGTTKIIKWAYKLLKIGAPLLVVVFGILDFVKSLLNGEDKGFKEAWQRFIKRLIAAIVVILLPVLLTFILNLSGVLKQYGIDTSDDIYCIFK